MPGRKSSKEKKRRCSRSCCPEGAAGPDGSDRKRRSTESSHGALEETKCNELSGGKLEEAEQTSDIEEGGLDLTVSLKPVSFYIGDKKEMLQQCFCVIGEKKLQKMLPDTLKNCSMDEIKRLCMEQLELLSEKKLLKILEGKIGADSDTDEEADGGDKTGGDSVSQQDNCIDSTSFLREDSKVEGQESKQVRSSKMKAERKQKDARHAKTTLAFLCSDVSPLCMAISALGCCSWRCRVLHGTSLELFSLF
ncbi:caspase activity and apoptosis inhibitor 1 isoform X2 [Taeniopygia guttata]|uniref:caspase activity and apoptosis inhibitor 1 isoform X2 n=1 Tax=Taeniopygia guttata TaxID=59729 RepID=UPI003BB86644